MNKLLLQYLKDVNEIEPMEEKLNRMGFRIDGHQWIVNIMIGSVGIISLWFIAQEIAMKLRLK